MRLDPLLVVLVFLVAAPLAQAQQAAQSVPPDVMPITQVPASYPRDVPLPQSAKPVAARDRGDDLVVLFQGTGKAEPLRAAYEAALPKKGWTISGADREGPEQGITAQQGKRSLFLQFWEVGPELRIQVVYKPDPAQPDKPPAPPAPTPPTSK